MRNYSLLTVATRQSFLKVMDLICHYGMVIVDEAHHLTSFKGTYADILSKLMAPIRIGLTATPHKDPEAVLVTEGLLGPLIGEYTINEGIKDGFMATPKIILTRLAKKRLTVPTEIPGKVRELFRYDEVYDAGIVHNLELNRTIVDFAKEYAKQGKSCLIMVREILHRELLMNLCTRNEVEAKFVYGNTDSEVRTLAKEYLNEKKLKCVICTAVWKEGVNIPELDVVINAAGGKAEIPALQAIGRGLRRTETKTELIFHDFFIPSHRFLVEHFGYRLTLYMDNGWI
jgi:superfamily II DNA or RNA helicase